MKTGFAANCMFAPDFRACGVERLLESHGAQTAAGAFDATAYWRKRMAAQPDLLGAGTRPFGLRYQRYLYRLKEAAIRRVLRRVGAQLDGMRVLNVGCGSGYFEPVFAAYGAAEVVGVDLATTVIEKLQRQQRFQYGEVDITRPLPDWLAGRTFDLVTAIDVLYHIVEEACFAAAMNSMCTLCLADGGLLLWTDSPKGRGSDEQPHVRHRGLPQYACRLAPLGASILATTPMYHLFDDHTRWSDRLTRHPRIAYPLMYAFDRLFASHGWRKTANCCAVAMRGWRGSGLDHGGQIDVAHMQAEGCETLAVSGAGC